MGPDRVSVSLATESRVGAWPQRLQTNLNRVWRLKPPVLYRAVLYRLELEIAVAALCTLLASSRNDMIDIRDVHNLVRSSQAGPDASCDPDQGSSTLQEHCRALLHLDIESASR